ncbi:hypothetical protein AAG570_002989, partial [Ranatra chinensis]
LNTVDLDHNYSRPWNWRPENSNTKPVKTLFIARTPNTVTRTGWTDMQKRLFDRISHILNYEMLARLSMTGSWNEPVLRRISINKSARRFRSTLATISWEQSKVPSLVERLISNPGANSKWNMDTLIMLIQRPWDPAAFGLSCYTPNNLPGNPLLVVVPNGVNVENQQYSRAQKWHTYLSNLGTVVVVDPPSYCNKTITLTCSLEQMLIATRAKLAELRSDYIGKKIILVGLNTGAALACQVALLEHVTAVVCLGFPFNTVEDKRGQPDDGILNLTVPVLFVVGQYAATCRLHVETGLVVVGAADDQLRISKGKQKAEGITQSMVDRCVVDEVGDFIGTILSNPYSSGRNDSRPRFKLIEKKRKISIQDEMFGKKQRKLILMLLDSFFGSPFIFFFKKYYFPFQRSPQF